VLFDDERTDHYGMPAMTIRYTLTETDHRTIDLLRTNLARMAKLVGNLLGEPAFAPGGSSLHYQGTVRMGPADDGASVCDPFCRVWGVRNLNVGGNGVIPTSTSANPTLTNVALAVRAATELARSLLSESPLRRLVARGREHRCGEVPGADLATRNRLEVARASNRW
jgi:choline dehydrogenase-like flavoprotein